VIPYSELEAFFCDLVANAQRQGITCAITSGMACVHFGVAATTMDCDVLCKPEEADAFRALVGSTSLRGLFPNYRGNISPPLDARWLKGGWTSHFTWKTKPDETCLDIFGIAPRGSSAWENQLAGFYAEPNVVAEMKRTNREKDWPFATALGGLMLINNDLKGWLHLHDPEVLRTCLGSGPPPEEIYGMRPILRLAPFNETLRVKRLLLAEREFWRELDQIRIRIFQQYLRPYTSAVRKTIAGRKDLSLDQNHEIRILAAERFLPCQPLRDYGLAKMVQEARTNVSMTIGPDVVEWLPSAIDNFYGL
jgi:hypothetical protein